MAKVGLFLGCITPLRYPGIESSTLDVLEALGVDAKILEGTSCCPAPGVFRSFDQEMWRTLGARNLALAEEQDVEILNICNGCYGSLAESDHQLREDPKKMEKVNNVLSQIGKKYNGTAKVRHLAEFLHRDVGLEKIAKRVKNKQDHLKAAIHYGCHFLKPRTLKEIDDPERPKILDELVEVTGAKSIPYKDKQLCCGAGGGVRARTKDVAQKMTTQKMNNINEVGANVIIDICPFCHLQFDQGQEEVENKVPVLHLSQLYVLAFDLPKERMGVEAHTIPVNF
ncbi:MAG: CoB--CoM heterodisulfide reductase subunit B [Methanomassiliicoccales archaeon]|nr:MAG: CoB--CoM heterodisulfide reductase subunit B [Methanomassiliicoccales archaeon]